MVSPSRVADIISIVRADKQSALIGIVETLESCNIAGVKIVFRSK